MVLVSVVKVFSCVNIHLNSCGKLNVVVQIMLVMTAIILILVMLEMVAYEVVVMVVGFGSSYGCLYVKIEWIANIIVSEFGEFGPTVLLCLKPGS